MSSFPTTCTALIIALSGTWLANPAPAQDTAPKDAKSQPTDADMMEMGQPGENHKLLAGLVGTWNYKVKFWMAPGAPPTESVGTAVRKPLMGGRYFVLDTTGKFQMPGPDGKMQSIDFKGMEVDGFDNVKKKFVSSWIDNMGTSILMSEGTYDPSTKTFTYSSEEEMAPGMKTKVRETIQVLDKDHHIFEWYEDHGGQEVRTMEITYARAQ